MEVLGDRNRIWRELMQKQRNQLGQVACADFLIGLERLRLPVERAPSLVELNQILNREGSPFRVVAVSGLIEPAEFFSMLRQNTFPVVTKLRDSSEHLYTYDPDFWHDAFGHMPFLVHPGYCALYRLFGELGKNEKLHPQLSALYWYSVEFGLMRDAGKNEFKIYGSGILPSPEEVNYCLSPATEKLPFDPELVTKLTYAPGQLQKKLFWVQSLGELQEKIETWAAKQYLPQGEAIEIRRSVEL